MPAFVKTPADEKAWTRAKNAVLKSRGLAESDMSDKDWGLVTHVYKEIKRGGKGGKVIEGDKLLKIIEGTLGVLAKARTPKEYVAELDDEYDEADEDEDDDDSAHDYLKRVAKNYAESNVSAASVIQPATLKLAKAIARDVFTASELKSAGVAMAGGADAFAASIKKGGLKALVRARGPALSKAMRKHCADTKGLGECTRAVALLTKGV